jgi:hypothetical protein
VGLECRGVEELEAFATVSELNYPSVHPLPEDQISREVRPARAVLPLGCRCSRGGRVPTTTTTQSAPSTYPLFHPELRPGPGVACRASGWSP